MHLQQRSRAGLNCQPNDFCWNAVWSMGFPAFERPGRLDQFLLCEFRDTLGVYLYPPFRS